MKNFRISLKNVAMTVACLAASLVLFTGCEKDDPTPEPDNGIAEIGKTYVSTTANAEKVYTLKVSKNLTRSSAAATDTYVLLYVDKSGEVKTSTGVVTSSVGEVLTLTPTGGTPFTVNVTVNGITGISGNITFTDNSTTSGGSLTPFTDGEIEITGTAITADRVLGVPGMTVSYVYNERDLLEVNNNATLTVLPGTAIRFTKAEGGIDITKGATVKMLGEDKLRELDAAGNLATTPGTKSGHVTLKGGATKGSWDGVVVKTTTDNQFTYVDFINGGSSTQFQNDVAVLTLTDARAGISHCTVSGSLGHGIALRDNFTLSAFDNNKVENVDKAPVWMRGSLTKLEKFDMTSDFTNNTNKYVQVWPAQTQSENAVISQTSVPYYFNTYGSGGVSLKADLTINEGVTIYMSANYRIESLYKMGVLKINGTVEKPVQFTRLPNSSYYWDCISFNGGAGYSINNCILEYGGGSNSYDYILYLDGCGVSLTNVVIRNSYGYGVKLHRYSGTLNLSHSNVTFANNTKGNVYDIRTSPYQVLTALP